MVSFYFMLSDIISQTDPLPTIKETKLSKSEQSLSKSKNTDITPRSANASCQPIRNNVKQYYVNLNGITYPKHIPSYHNFSIDFDCINKLNVTKKILYWNTFSRKECYGYGCFKRVLKDRMKCLVNCELTNDKKSINESDLILVNMADPVDTPPTKRGANERWVFVLYESPMTYKTKLKSFNGLFNLTATYRQDSDATSFYYANFFIWQHNSKFEVNYDYFQNKTRMVAILVSNCRDHANRLPYVNQMQNHITVDIFGKCGKPCMENFSDRKTGECKQIIAKEYLFYLAFENSVCKDYITEKFFYMIQQSIVPVVRGAGSYEYYVR